MMFFILPAKKSNSKNLSTFKGIAAAVVLATIISACGGNNKTGAANQAGQVLDYKVMAVQPHQATLNVDYPASIQGQQNIEIRPKVDGYVEKIYVDEGSVVTKGQLLFKINAPQ
jgi:membrane fusion protein (multidrug efflux system)